jgi:CelD/BcsL family acetyltransferase involved in cellulose biosynthesis
MRLPDTGIYRDLFCQMYGVDAPVVTLGEIIHWWRIVCDAGLDHLPINKEVGYVPDGYFYATHVPVPTASVVAEAIAQAHHHHADWILYPVIRAAEPSRALREAGFVAVPWFVEAEYHLRAGVDADLRALLGKNRHGDMRRASRRAAELYRYEVLRADEIDDAVLARFDRLHRINLDKYHHRHNHLSRAAVRAMLDSPLGAGLRLFLRFPHRGGEPVQAGLHLIDPTAGPAMSFVAQGIDRSAVPAGQNLYKAWFYDMYRWGADHGVTVFTLGRGAELNKFDMGANVFHLLDNHLAPTNGRADDAFTLAEQLGAEFGALRAHLAERVARRGVTDHVQLRWC